MNVDFISDQFAAAINGKYHFVHNIGRWYVKRGEFWTDDSNGTVREYFRQWCRQRADINFSPKACDDVLKTLQFDPHISVDIRSIRRNTNLTTGSIPVGR